MIAADLRERIASDEDVIVIFKAQCATVSSTSRYVGLRAIDPAGNISYPAKAGVPRH